MFKAKKLALAMGVATLALTFSTTSMADLVPNGDFEIADGASWGIETAAGSVFTFPTSGGNGDGYLQMDNTSASWGGVAISTDDPSGSLLGDFKDGSGNGLVAGGTYDFLWDMKSAAAATRGGIKLESWNEGGFMNQSAEYTFASTTDWASYSQSYTIDPNATRLKIVLLGLDNTSVYGYDNVCIDNCNTSVVPVPAAVWLFGSGLLGLVGVARRKKALAA